MKKQLLAAILAAAVALSLAACSGNSTPEASNDTDTPISSTSSTSEGETSTSSISEGEAPTSSTSESEASTLEKDVPVLPIGETISIDNKCDFYLDYVNITNDVMPPQPGNWYSHYKADDGKVYVDVCVAYKNLATRDIDADEVMTGTLIYSGQYEFSGFSMIEEDSRSDFTYSNITSIAPLSTEYIHYLFSVPEEVQTAENAVDVLLTIAGGEYKVIVKEGAVGTVTQNGTDGTTQETSGEVALGETIFTKNSEFFVDYANITSDVIPLHPGSWYSHYEADDGKVYVDFCIGYKNTSSKSVGADDVISAKLKYADKYDYTGFSMVEKDSRSDFTYSNITSISPLSIEYVHYLFSVPEDVENSSDTVVISFRIDGNDYTYSVR